MLPVLDFDNEIKTPVMFYAGNHYDKTFLVKKNGIDYDWANVTEIIVTAKSEKKSATSILELKLSAGDIGITTGVMTWHLTTVKTTIEPGEYKCFEMVVIFSATKPKVWWDSRLIVKRRGTQFG